MIRRPQGTNKPRYSTAKRKALELLKKARISSAPIDLDKIVVLLDVKVREEPFRDVDFEVSGMVHVNKNETIIGLNKLHPKTRKRFSLAHELGHVVLHKKNEFHIDESRPLAYRSPLASKGTDPKEIEANQFAAELVMPEFLLVDDLKALPKDIDEEDAVCQLADKYEVSMQAMTIRLHTLGLIKYR
jgi:Zn-dependent peptidase ImmA (M78 family)